MPFVARRLDPDSPADAPPDPLALTFFSVREVRERLPQGSAARARSPRWQLGEAYGYVAEDGRYFVAPAHTGGIGEPGQGTDLTSVPGFLWGILGPYGQHLRSALLHDHLCDVADGVIAAHPDDRDAAGRPIPPGRTPTQIRTEADDLFRETLRSEGVGPARRWIFWTGVSYGRFFIYRRVLAIALAALAFAAAVLGLHALTVALGGGPPRVEGWLSDRAFWSVMLGVAVLMAVLRRWVFIAAIPLSLVTTVACLAGAGPDAPSALRSLSWHAVAAGGLLLAALALGSLTDVRVALIAVLLAPLILPVVLLTTLVQLTLALPDLISWAVRGFQDDEPVVGPLLGAPK
ncbi:MAG TPA: DUF1353 domain-containing protein [Jatrophihabitans sp.]|uniref:DUF1353 domain-containing protein n=1 Tax=Jatrophihabitans sp. TaxID=1932789 RepID=UPI002EE0B215